MGLLPQKTFGVVLIEVCIFQISGIAESNFPPFMYAALKNFP